MCDTCEDDFTEGDEAHRCAPCDFDCCSNCFTKAASVAKTSSGGDGVKKMQFGKTRGSGGSSTASASGGPAAVMTKSILKNSPTRLAQTSTVLPAGIPNMPGMVAAHDLAAAGQNPFLAQEIVADEVDEIELNSKAMLESLEVQTPPVPDGVDAKFYNAMGSLLDTKVAPVLTGLQQLTVAVNDLQQNAVHKREFTNLVGEVERIRIGCEQEFARSTEIASTVTSLSQNSVIHDNRIGALETQFRNLNVKGKGKGKGGFDDAFNRIAFTKWSDATGLEDRLAAMSAFMAKHFPKIGVSKVGVIHRGSFKDKTRTMTRVGFVEFASSDIRDFVLTKIESKKLKVDGHAGVKIERARTRNASERNTALTEASDLLKEHLSTTAPELDVVIQWTGRRGVTVGGGYAFDQPSGVSMGEFVGDFETLHLNQKTW